MVKKLSATELIVLNARRSALFDNLKGRDDASSSSLAASYNLPIADVRYHMKANNVTDTDKE